MPGPSSRCCAGGHRASLWSKVITRSCVAHSFSILMLCARPILTSTRGTFQNRSEEVMSCNAHNHSLDCTCDFRGGHSGSRPPRPIPAALLLGDLAPPRQRRVFQGRPRPCPRCGLATLYIPGRNGGRYIVAADGSFLKHSCPRQVPERPLSLARAKWKRDWLPATLRTRKSRLPGQVLEITGLALGDPFRVVVLDNIAVDQGQPAVCRWSPDEPSVLEISYSDAMTGDLTRTRIRARRLRR